MAELAAARLRRHGAASSWLLAEAPVRSHVQEADCQLAAKGAAYAGDWDRRPGWLEVSGAVPQTAATRALNCCYVSGC